MITGSGVADTSAFSGGNTAVLITDAGVVIVDTSCPDGVRSFSTGSKTVTNKPVTTIINTHTTATTPAATSSFGTTVDSIVQENTKANMAKMAEFKGDKARFLPKRTYKDRLTIGKGKDQIDLYYFGRGHTNGDTFVVFPALRTMHAGDMFAWKALPYIDTITAAAWHPSSDARKGGRDDQGCRHGHYRTHTDTDDMERTEGIRRLHPGFSLPGLKLK